MLNLIVIVNSSFLLQWETLGKLKFYTLSLKDLKPLKELKNNRVPKLSIPYLAKVDIGLIINFYRSLISILILILVLLSLVFS